MTKAIFHHEHNCPALNDAECDCSVGDGRLAAELSVLRKRLIEEFLKLNEGNRTQAARELGISRTSLIAYIKRYGIE